MDKCAVCKKHLLTCESCLALASKILAKQRGKKSKRKLTTEQAKAMVEARERKKKEKANGSNSSGKL